ncbi:MAG: hypothetical protein PVI26_06785, partial [Chitinispirillia bacterium]
IKTDSLRLIISKITDGKSGIFVVDINTGKMKPLLDSEFQEESPYYAQNGRIYFSADYDGIYNIYSILPDGGDLNRHTYVNGGAFSPVLMKNDTLLFSEYTSKGFRISKCKSKGVPFRIQNKNNCHFKPVPYPLGTVKINSELYRKKYLKPIWELYTGIILKDEDKAFLNRIKTGDVNNPPWKISLDFITELSMDKSDAIGQKKMHLGGALMLNTIWESYEGESKNIRFNNNVFEIYNHTFFKPNSILQTNQERKQCRNQYGFTMPLGKTAMDYYSENKNFYSDSTSKDSGDIIIRSFLIPFLGIENNSLKPTIGMNSQAFLFLFLPAIINIEPFIEWHIARDLYIGLKSQLAIYPFLIFKNFQSGFFFNIPLWIRRDLKSYNNEDISYNLNGKGSYGAFIGVEIEPVEYTRNKPISPDSIISETSIKSVISFFYGIDLYNSIPISKYTSFKVSTKNFGAKYNRDVIDVFNNKDTVNYNLLTSSLNMVEFIFPIIRNINRGRLYTDNLYGTIFYQLEFSGSNKYLSNPKLSLFTDKKYVSESAFLSHKIGLGIELGLIKDFIFERKFVLKTSWDIFNEEISADLSVKF